MLISGRSRLSSALSYIGTILCLLNVYFLQEIRGQTQIAASGTYTCSGSLCVNANFDCLGDCTIYCAYDTLVFPPDEGCVNVVISAPAGFVAVTCYHCKNMVITALTTITMTTANNVANTRMTGYINVSTPDTGSFPILLSAGVSPVSNLVINTHDAANAGSIHLQCSISQACGTNITINANSAVDVTCDAFSNPACLGDMTINAPNNVVNLYCQLGNPGCQGTYNINGGSGSNVQCTSEQGCKDTTIYNLGSNSLNAACKPPVQSGTFPFCNNVTFSGDFTVNCQGSAHGCYNVRVINAVVANVYCELGTTSNSACGGELTVSASLSGLVDCKYSSSCLGSSSSLVRLNLEGSTVVNCQFPSTCGNTQLYCGGGSPCLCLNAGVADSCSNLFAGVATIAPTSAPTYPTSAPSFAPTMVPSNAPTMAPSMVPSVAPTYPTSSPTAAPVAPTSAPTMLPTSVPSNAPTSAPSVAPSHAPSSVPSNAPSSAPSNVPSFAPSSVPSQAPTHAPSSVPSNAPSLAPSQVPTKAPSNVPSFAPTVAPSSVPSNAPSVAPSDAPTSVPSAIPTDAPTHVPSFAPSDVPTFAPTFAPSNVPSHIPTVQPTSVPSNAPTVVPSGVPSVPPTSVPSLAPSSSPTRNPTRNPVTSGPTTSQPSTSPTTPKPTTTPTTTTASGTTGTTEASKVVKCKVTARSTKAKSDFEGQKSNIETAYKNAIVANTNIPSGQVTVVSTTISQTSRRRQLLQTTHTYVISLDVTISPPNANAFATTLVTAVNNPSHALNGGFETSLRTLVGDNTLTSTSSATVSSGNTGSSGGGGQSTFSVGLLVGILVGVFITLGILFYVYVQYRNGKCGSSGGDRETVEKGTEMINQGTTKKGTTTTTTTRGGHQPVKSDDMGAGDGEGGDDGFDPDL